MNHTTLDTIIDSLENGQMKQAREQTVYRCKTKPVQMAYNVGTVVGALCDPDGHRKNPDLAVRFLKQFEK